MAGCHGAATWHTSTHALEYGAELVTNHGAAGAAISLEAADSLAVDGVLYNGDSTSCKEALNVFSGINELGGL
jgi:hypothetical protein